MSPPTRWSPVLALVVPIALAACVEPPAAVGVAAGALTVAQCNEFASGGKTRLCHATGSSKSPYVLVDVAVDACARAHAAHAGDFVSLDGTCSGQGALPPGAPCDATLACVSGYECRDDTCQATDLCRDVTCVGADDCHLAWCDPQSGACLPDPLDGIACDDGDGDTTGDTCVAGLCIGAPAAPGDLGATLTGAREITLAWSPVPGASGYRVSRSDGGDFVQLGEVATPGFVDGDLAAGLSFTYRVVTVGAGGTSEAAQTQETTPDAACFGARRLPSSTAVAVVALPDGGFVAGGSFSASLALGDDGQALVPVGGSDAWLARFDQDGALVWARGAGGTGSDVTESIVVDGDGLVVVGTYAAALTFGSGAGAITLPSAATNNVFLARWSFEGELVWARRGASGEGSIFSPRVAKTGDGLALTGTFRGVFRAGDDPAAATHTAALQDIFVARYAADGGLAWVRYIGGAGQSVGGGVAVLADGTIVATGGGATGATFGGDGTGTSAKGIYVAAYGPDGDILWSRVAGPGGATSAYGRDIVALADGGFAISGSYTVDTFGAGEANETPLSNPGLTWGPFIARYSGDGTLAWVRGAPTGAASEANAIVVRRDGGLAIGGMFITSTAGITWGAGEPTATTITGGDFNTTTRDIFVARFADGGGFEDALHAPHTALALNNNLRDAAVDRDGRMFVVGAMPAGALFWASHADAVALSAGGAFMACVAR
ncbi:MAG: fibronectin type III domain-containing protein [Deltaproteobacteria bacterium]|nr:fibronectin type III domain-containing protein [Deltaproteobacteria bacterium]